ncbi:MAG: sigma-54-dependent Fis family transcriptional regulator [Planctomycetia bacterium]|jgi:DNA-binding NtrC family response regulator|nr:sigma-54-dependent Fis family transcriptional regulator [Planctomycetia bacterium]MCC7316226.1 sigma-54-dependent Fis family transcriptional regulator [Planctomycetota bacterium]
MTRVLIVEDERVLAKNVREKLVAHGYEARVAHSGKEALAESAQFLPELVLLDLCLPDTDGLDILPQLKAESPFVNVIVVTAHGNERIAVDAMKAGATEYLTKPVELDELLLVMARIVERQQTTDNLTFLKSREEESSGLDRIIGESAPIRVLKENIRRLTRGDVLSLPDPPTVLFTGETGTGKDLAARAIHYQGPRRGKPFIQVNCTALPATLFESELFGHMKGSFTSATQAKRGLFDVAQGGSIFLDEIGHMELEMQAKLLHAIESREIRPLGGTQTRKINVHIIAATNRNLEEAVEQGEFRRDLYHRLRVVEIALPPLRERLSDIPLLTSHFLALHCNRFGMKPRRLSPEAIAALEQYEWRGNIRELSHTLESALLQADCEVLDPMHLPLSSREKPGGAHVEIPNGLVLRLEFDNACPTLEEIEHRILVATFEHTGQNLSRTARILGITREAVRYRLNKLAEATGAAQQVIDHAS